MGHAKKHHASGTIYEHVISVMPLGQIKHDAGSLIV
jgi:hypothetical protein